MVDPTTERQLDLGVPGLASKAREDLREPLPLEVDGSPPLDGEGTEEEWIAPILQAGDEEPTPLADLGEQAMSVVAEGAERDAVLHPVADLEELDLRGPLANEGDGLGTLRPHPD